MENILYIINLVFERKKIKTDCMLNDRYQCLTQYFLRDCHHTYVHHMHSTHPHYYETKGLCFKYIRLVTTRHIHTYTHLVKTSSIIVTPVGDGGVIF